MTLKCIAGIERPDSGHIELDGVTLFDSEKRINLPPQKRHVGYLFQNYALFPNMTVRQNILCGLRAEKRSRAQSEQALREVMELLGLTGLERRLPSQLSGGQQQRVAIARALALEPDILCFDEPTSALDPELTGEVLRVIKDLKSTGSTMIVVTHEMEFARNVSDKVLFMADGVVEESGTPEEVFGTPQSDKTKSFLNKSLESV